jgi:hypothetical protein
MSNEVWMPGKKNGEAEGLMGVLEPRQVGIESESSKAVDGSR